MNILKYLNSDAVRNHLESLNYNFTPVEMAWIIYQCNHVTLKEKFKAWETMIHETNDCEISIETEKYTISGLHKMIEDYMALINKYYDVFTSKEDDCAYYCDFKHKDESEWNENKNFAFRTVSDCWDYISRECSIVGLQTVRITKKYLYEDGNGEIRVYFTPYKKVIKISLDHYELDSESFDLYCNTFLKMCPLFPVPFEEGDIVIENTNSLINNDNTIYPFVIKYIPPKDKRCLLEYKDIFSLGYDEMMTYGFTVDHNGHIYEDHEACYMDLEYYKCDDNDKLHMLQCISDCIRKGDDPNSLKNVI